MKSWKATFLLFFFAVIIITGCKKDWEERWNQLKPVPDFSFTIQNSGELPVIISFTNRSENGESYQWSFGDGSTSTNENPLHTFNNGIVYEVRLTVTNPYGKKSITKQVDAGIRRPSADFEYIIVGDGMLPALVDFTNTSTGADSSRWDFSDGASSPNRNASHGFDANRIYEVKLVVENAAGKDSVTKSVEINPITHSVLPYLITPTDRPFHKGYYESVRVTTLKLQDWYKSAMGNNKTFMVNPLVVTTLSGLHEADWYNSYNGPSSGTDPRFYAFYNTYSEMQQLLGNKFSPGKYVYLVYVAAPGGGAGIPGFCAMGDQDLAGLLGDNPENPNVNRWVGGAGHELGHAFGLPHPANQNSQALMWTGYLTFPNCILQSDDRDILNNSNYFK